MVQILDRHHDLFRWVAEFCTVPLHMLALGEHHAAATFIGSVILAVYATAAVRHARVHGVSTHG